MRVRLERVPEENDEIDAALGDRRTHLLIATEGAAEEAMDSEAELARELGPGRPGGVQLVLREGATVVARPLEHVGLAVVMRDQRELLAAGHRRRGGGPGGGPGGEGGGRGGKRGLESEGG